MANPVFDHSKPANTVMAQDGKFLSQGGHKFSYAEYDKQKKRYIPEPDYVEEGKVSSDQLADQLGEVLITMTELIKTMQGFQKVVLDNLKQFVSKK